MQLPSYETDHFELDNGEDIHRENPDTFPTPSKIKRDALKTGDLVKLIFRMEVSRGSDDLSIERMWVQISNVERPFYSGILDNDPVGSDCVTYGQKVVFRSEHIIDIYEG